MRVSSLLSGLSALAALTAAEIVGIAAPKTIAPGAYFPMIIETADFIQSIQDVAIAFGISPGTTAPQGSLGTLLSSRYLGPDESNITTNITHWVQIPTKVPKGQAVITGILFNLVGAAYGQNTEDFTVAVKVGKTTSSEYVSST